MARWVSLIILLIVIAVTGFVLYRVMAVFLLPLFLAAVLTVIFRPLHARVQQRLPNRPNIASMLTTSVIMLAVLLPIAGIVTLAMHEAVGAVGGDVLDRAEVRITRLRKSMSLELPFTRLMDEEGKDAISLADIDKQIEELPVALPDPTDNNSALIRQLEQLADGLKRLNRRLSNMVYMASEDSDDSDDSADMERVKSMLAHRGPDAFHAIVEIEQTVNLSLKYLLDPDSFPIQLPDATDEGPPDEEIQEAADDALDLLDPDGPDREITVNELQRRYRRIGALYATFRVDLLGGPFWAWLTDFVNPTNDQLNSLRSNVQTSLRRVIPSVAGQATAIAGSLLLGLGIMSLAVFYFLKDGPTMIDALMRLSPLDDRYEQELVTEFESVSRAVVLATLLSALAQGVLAGIAYVLTGFNSVFLLTTLTIIFAMIPFIGAAAIWVPASLWLLVIEERWIAALILFIYGATIVSMADNIIKPYILHGQSKLHPLLALLSVLGGVQALGPIGILVGPMVVSFLQALLNILQDELQGLERPDVGAKT